LAHKLAPTVTPFVKGAVDVPKLKAHVGKVLGAGIDYIWLCGTTGLGPSLTAKEKLACLQGLAEYADNIIFQLGSLNLDDGLMLAREAKKLKIHAIASYPPYFYPKVTDDWAAEHLTRLSKVYPLFAYNFPLATGYEITPALLNAAKKNGANIIGVKDTVNDVAHMLSFKYELGRDFLVYSGPDTMILPGLRSGLDGAVAGSANYVPELMVKIDRDLGSPGADEAQRTITTLSGVCRKYGQWAANYSMVKAIKGYDVGQPRPPVFPLSPANEAALKSDALSVYHR
jgi:2-dehydro-3-deoxy-phosphogluconate/2-dehydro-3-deoxy-6-phosphogalactonate aldolase